MQPLGHNLAELNIGRLLAPTDDMRVAEFMNALDTINATGKRMPGGRLDDTSPHLVGGWHLRKIPPYSGRYCISKPCEPISIKARGDTAARLYDLRGTHP